MAKRTLRVSSRPLRSLSMDTASVWLVGNVGDQISEKHIQTSIVSTEFIQCTSQLVSFLGVLPKEDETSSSFVFDSLHCSMPNPKGFDTVEDICSIGAPE